MGGAIVPAREAGEKNPAHGVGEKVPAAFKRRYPRAERGKNSPFCSGLFTPKNPQEFFQTKIETCKTTKHSNGFTQQEKRNIDAVITGLDKGSRIHIESYLIVTLIDIVFNKINKIQYIAVHILAFPIG